jgi:large subunit ribosomal protein L44e
MKYPKEISTYCPKCKKHTAHAVSIYKAGKPRTMAWGSRRQERRKHGYGGQKFPELKRTAKTTKKSTLRLKCRVCSFTVARLGIRLRKLEIGA